LIVIPYKGIFTSSSLTNSLTDIKHTEAALPQKQDKFYFNIAVLTAVLSGLISQYITYVYNYNYAYRDAIYRMEAARRFIDSLTPGLYNQLGSVWLPVPNLILMPFANIDFLWETGLAASIVYFPAFIICSIMVFKTLRMVTNNNYATWFGYLIFVFNYNILYFQTTAMTEQLYLTCMFCSMYFILVWLKEKKQESLILSSVSISLAIGTRYDAWPVAIISIVYVLFISYKNKDNTSRNFLLFALLPLAAIFTWIIYNWFRYGDPLEFSRGPYSTLHQLKYYEERGRLLTKNDFWLSAKVYFSALKLYSGLLYSVTGFLGLIIFTLQKKFSLRSLILYILWIPLPFTLLLLYKGQLIIEIPDSIPPGYFNSRYGLYIYPAIAVFSGITAAYLLKLRYKAVILTVLAVIFGYQQYLFFCDFPDNIPAIAEAKASYSKPSEDLSFFLKQNYKGGRILYDNVIFALHPWSGIDLADRITPNTFILGKEALNAPAKYVEWVLFYTEATNDKVYEVLKNNPEFLNNFELKFSEYGVEAYGKK